MILDMMRLSAPEPHIYDLPFHYTGHLINSSFPAQKATAALYPMPGQFGYQHLWKECEAVVAEPNAWFTILQGERFYSVTTTLDNGRTFLVRSGANDPNNNLRSEPAVIFRQTGKAGHVFASVVEPHGLFDPNLELTIGALPQTAKTEVIYNNDDYTAMRLTLRDCDRPVVFITVNRGFDESASHELTIGGTTYTWKGNFLIKQ